MIRMILLLAGIGMAVPAVADPPGITRRRPNVDEAPPDETGPTPYNKSIFPVIKWTGVVKGKEPPATSEIITNQADFTKLWKNLGKGDDGPDIAFDRAFVFVVTSAGGETAPIERFRVNPDSGDFRRWLVVDEVGPGNGFSYYVGVFTRDGIKSYKQKPIGPSN